MRRIAFIGGVLIVMLVVLGIAQLLLPGIAAQQLRDRLEQSGTVLKVEVDAFPAIQLLWHHADKVVVRMRNYNSSSSRLSSTLSSVGDADTLDASAEELKVGLLTLRDAALRKQANQLVGQATVTQSDLQASFPVLDSLRVVDSSGGELTLRGTATVLGVTATADATVRAQNGTLVVSPDVPFGGLATISLFSNPHVKVQNVSATPVPGGFTLIASAQLK